MANLRLRRNQFPDRGFEEFYSWIDDFFNGSLAPTGGVNPMAASFKVDVEDREDAYVVDAELPGYDKDDITITLEDGRLSIAAEKSESEEEEGKNYLHKERRTSSMKRTMCFKDIDEEHLEATLDAGVLRIVVPKKAPVTKAKTIDIG